MYRSSYEELVRNVEWSSYAGANGRDFPMAMNLAAVASSDEGESGQAMGAVLSHVCHQGVLEESSAQVAPLLFEILKISEPVHEWIALLGYIELMQAAWSWPRKLGFLPRRRRFAGSLPPIGLDDVKRHSEYDTYSEQLQTTLDANVELLCEFLSDDDPRTRAMAARLLGIAEHVADQIVGLIADACAREKNEVVRSGLLMTLAFLARQRKLQSVAQDYALLALKSERVLERACGAAALLLLEPAQCLSNFSETIYDALRLDSMDMTYFAWGSGSPCGLIAEVLSIVPVPEEVAVEYLMDGMMYWILKPGANEVLVEWRNQDVIAARIVERVFREHIGRRDFLTPQDLSPLQRLLVAKLARIQSAALSGYTFQACAIRNVWKDASRLLELESGGLDQVMEGWWEGRTVRWPLWKWWHQAAAMDGWSKVPGESMARRYVQDMMRRQLSPSGILAAAVDAVGGSYDIPHAPLVRLVASVADSIEEELRQYVYSVMHGADHKQAALVVFPSLVLAQTRKVSWLSTIQELMERVEPADLKAEGIQLAQHLGAE